MNQDELIEIIVELQSLERRVTEQQQQAAHVSDYLDAGRIITGFHKLEQELIDLAGEQ